MDVVTLTSRRQARVIDKPNPRVRGNYVLVKVHVAPMCNEHHAYANWDFRDRNRPDSLGHEAAGEVVEAGNSTRFRSGDRVVALSGFPCGACQLCKDGYYAHCEATADPLVVNDSPSGECCFAQYIVKPDWMLLPIPAGMSYEHASMACCGMGATYTALENMEVTSGQTVLVTGLGQVGLGAVINVVSRGARAICLARHPYRTALALRLGATAVLDPLDETVVARLRALTAGGQGVDAAVECSAASMYQRLALESLRRRGQLTFLGESGDLTVDVDRHVIQKAARLSGSLDLNLHHAAGLMDVIASSGPLIDTFITHTFPMTNVARAWELQLQGDCGKVLLYPWITEEDT